MENEIVVKIYVPEYIQIIAGVIQKEDAERIIAGADFDETLKEIHGDYPPSIESDLPAEMWVARGEPDQIKTLIREISISNISPPLKKKPVLKNVVMILPMGLDYEDEFQKGKKVFSYATPETLENIISKEAAGSVNDLYEMASKKQEKLFETLLGGENQKPVRMWAFIDYWKGQYVAYIPKSPEEIKEILFVYFITSEILPSTDEITDADEEFYEIILDSEAPLSMYLAAVVVGDAVVNPQSDSDHDIGLQRLILEYKGGGSPIVRYDSCKEDD